MEKVIFLSTLFLLNSNILWASHTLAQSAYFQAIKQNNPHDLNKVLENFSIKEIAKNFPRTQSFYTPAFAVGNKVLVQILLTHKVQGSYSKRVRKNDLKRLILTGNASLVHTAFLHGIVTPKDIDNGILKYAYTRNHLKSTKNAKKISHFLKAQQKLSGTHSLPQLINASHDHTT